MDMTTPALVLREVDYKEADKLLTILTPEEGKMTVTARACRRKNNRLAAGAQLLVYSEMTLYEFQGRRSIREANPEQYFRGVREDLWKLSLASYFAELTELIAPEGMPAQEYLSLLLNSLYALDRLNKPRPLVKTAFEWKLMSLAGYEPLIDGCAVCGREPEEPMFHLREGVLHCRECRNEVGDGISMPLSPAAVQALRHIVLGNPKRLFSFTLPDGDLKQLGEVSEAFVMTQLERGFRTLDYYKKIDN